jgi:hypothetical protein
MHHCARHVYLPRGGATLSLLHRNHIIPKQLHHLHGAGMGSQLLGGAGSASAYRGLADYQATTGKQPRMAGFGLKRLSAKLDKLDDHLHHHKKKKGNIHFHL